MAQDEIDPRLVRLSIEINGQLKVYENMEIRASGMKYANPLQNEASISIANLSKADADYLMTECSPFNKNRTSKKIILEAGRVSYGLSKIYEGNIGVVEPTQPPDIVLKFKCQEGQFLKGKLISHAQGGSVPLSTIAKGVANNLGMELVYQAKEKNISNYQFTGGALKEVDKLGSLGGVDAFVSDGRLYVKDVNVPLTGQVRVLDEMSGMVGIPQVTEQGIKATMLLDNKTTIGGALDVTSKIYPTVSGMYSIFKLGFDISYRDDPFYWIAEGVRMEGAKSAAPTGFKTKTPTRKVK